MLTADHKLAAQLATEAGHLLIEIRTQNANLAYLDLKDLGDRQSHEYLLQRLNDTRPDDAVLSEEGHDNLDRLNADRVWIIDPVDGTREFAEIGRSDWAVHVALWERGDLVAGAVSLPALGQTYDTETTTTVPDAHHGPVRVVNSRSRSNAAADAVVAAFDAELILMGSAGAKAMAVVRGEADIYAHTGGQYEWDSAAPVAVARAAGLHASRIDGSEFRYNQADVYLPDLLICRPEHAEKALAALHDAHVT